MKKQLILPRFNNEDEERDFWDTIDLGDYLEPSDLKPFILPEVYTHAKPKTKKITIRIPEDWIAKAKEKAAQLDVPYQSLMKQYIHKGLETK